MIQSSLPEKKYETLEKKFFLVSYLTNGIFWIICNVYNGYKVVFIFIFIFIFISIFIFIFIFIFFLFCFWRKCLSNFIFSSMKTWISMQYSVQTKFSWKLEVSHWLDYFLCPLNTESAINPGTFGNSIMSIVALAIAIALTALALPKNIILKLWQTEHEVPNATKIVEDIQGHYSYIFQKKACTDLPLIWLYFLLAYLLTLACLFSFLVPIWGII